MRGARHNASPCDLIARATYSLRHARVTTASMLVASLLVRVRARVACVRWLVLRHTLLLSYPDRKTKSAGGIRVGRGKVQEG